MKRWFAGKTVVLGVTGSIAAYKACDIASRLVEHGAEVWPVLTRSARELAAPAAFEAITGRRAITEMFGPLTTPEIGHVTLARRADLFLVAPATANILAKAAHGIADDWLSTSLLATRAPLLFAPAMNSGMWTHPATQANAALLRERGALFVGPGEGRLACGTGGPGRLIETQAILDTAACALHPAKSLAGKRALITSGANHEPVDPVRFLGNSSSGRMGRALALAALARGAEVTVITGPAEVAPPWGAEVVRVRTALEMRAAVMERVQQYDIFIAAAAVADYRAAAPAAEKIKRSAVPLTLELTPNPDILAEAAQQRRPGMVFAGFAAETADVPRNAAAKLEAKGVDLLLANTVGGGQCAIGAEESEAWLLARGGEPLALGRVSKDEIAARILDAAAARF